VPDHQPVRITPRRQRRPLTTGGHLRRVTVTATVLPDLRTTIEALAAARSMSTAGLVVTLITAQDHHLDTIAADCATRPLVPHPTGRVKLSGSFPPETARRLTNAAHTAGVSRSHLTATVLERAAAELADRSPTQPGPV